MSKKKIKAEEYNNYGKTMIFDLGESKGKFDKTYITPLEALNNIKNLFVGSPINPTQQFKTIETALKENGKLKECYKNELKNTAYYNNLALKYKKAVEILKKYYYMILFDYNLTYEEMVKYFEEQTDYEVGDYPTKEEYELLKEVLK